MTKLKNEYRFTFHQLHKNWRQGKSSPTLVFYGYQQDRDLCVITAIDDYLIRTKLLYKITLSVMIKKRNYY